MSCNTEPVDKKIFGIRIYNKLNELYGKKDYYEVFEIQNSLKVLDYPVSLEHWAMVAFMLPANVGEYLHAKATPMNVLDMKREMILAMTDGKRDSLNLPSVFKSGEDFETSSLTQMNLVNIVAMYAGYTIGRDLVNDLAGLNE